MPELNEHATKASQAGAFLKEYPFAALFIATPGATVRHTFLPLMYHDDSNSLFGHVARTAPIGSSLINGAVAIASFTGPNSYVSPTWSVGSPHRVPTWNYLAATATGVVERLHRDESLWALNEFTRVQERPLGSDWSAELNEARGDTLHKALLSFKVTAVEVELVAKLSQRQPPEERAAISAGLGVSSAPMARILGKAMEADNG